MVAPTGCSKASVVTPAGVRTALTLRSLAGLFVGSLASLARYVHGARLRFAEEENDVGDNREGEGETVFEVSVDVFQIRESCEHGSGGPQRNVDEDADEEPGCIGDDRRLP